MLYHLLLILSLLPLATNAFLVVSSTAVHSQSKTGCSSLMARKPRIDEEKSSSSEEGGPFGFLSNLDDMIDDFFYKRMGKGEIFYGKRKYKPSGDVEGDYNGFGLSDKLRIDMTREYRDEWLEEKKMRDEMRKLREEKENR